VKIAGVFRSEPFAVLGRYNVALSSALSRIRILTPHRRSYSEGGGEGDCAGVGAGVCACSVFSDAKAMATNR
jgi:hypothetical protein